jgi:hypothetical protein
MKSHQNEFLVIVKEMNSKNFLELIHYLNSVRIH